MADWPILQNSDLTEDDTAATSYSLTVSAGGTNSKGSYSTVVASLPADISALILEGSVATNAFAYIDIAVGAGGSEKVVVPNFMVTNASADFAYVIPLSVPKGTRIAVRYQVQSGGSASLKVKMQFVSRNFADIEGPQLWEDWGTNTATTEGTVATAGTSNAKGSFVQLKAATSLTARWIYLVWQNLVGARSVAIDLAVGAAASEHVILSDVFTPLTDNGYSLGPIPITIPAGTRISTRVASSVNSSNINISAYGGG